ncbi:MAG: helix-turn-helix domain-containing protein [Bacteroidia bacterium]
MAFFFVFGIGQTFFLDFLLITKRSKRISDYLLAGWFFMIGLHLTAFYFFWSGMYLENPYLLGWDQPFPLMHGPFLLLYVCSLTQAGFRLRWKHFLHFIPALVMYLALAPYLLGGADQLLNFLRQVQEMDFPWYYQPFIFMTQFSGLVYSAYCLWLLRKHKHQIESHFAYREQISLNWLRYLIVGLLGIGVIVALGIGIEGYLNVQMPIPREVVIFSSVIIWILFAGFFGIRQKAIFTDNVADLNSAPRESMIPVSPSTPLYQNSGLKPEEASELLPRLHDFMRQKKPFLEPRLTLPELAKVFQILPNHLSQLINEKEGKNFYQFINDYRLEEFKQRVTQPEYQHLSLLGLAMECGFNSKSTFNAVFKQNTGLTPSQYLKSVKKDSPED